MTDPPPTYKYLGCYKDNSSRDFKVPNPPNLVYVKTVYECQKKCELYSYFALQAGGACFCGNRYATTSQYGLHENQNTCYGRETGMSLGGPNANAVY